MRTFPTYFPSPPRGVWHLGPLPIRAYALFIIVGIVAALVIGDRRWEARGGQRGVIYDIALWAVPFGLLGGRLYHLATDWRTYWGPGGAGFWAAFRIWDGGLGIWGAVALGGVGAWIGCRRRGIPLPAFGDAIAPGIVLAQAIGRLGNYFNQELYGRETTVPWGLEIFYRRDPSGYVDPHSLDGVSTGQLAYVVQPTFLYELIWNLLLFFALIYVDRRFKLGHGRLFALYVAGYCIGRFCVELLRNDSATHIAGIRINVFTATFVFIGAVVYVMLAPKGREDPESLRGNDYAEESEPASEPADELASVGSAKATASTAGTAAKDDEPADPAKTEESAEVEDEQTGAEAAAPEAVQPEAVEPEAVEPEAVEPEAVKPEAVEPQAVEPEAAVAEGVQAEAKAESEADKDEEAGKAEEAEEVGHAEEDEEAGKAEEAEEVGKAEEDEEAGKAEESEEAEESKEAEEAEEAEAGAVATEAADAEVAEPEAEELEAESEEPDAKPAAGAEKPAEQTSSENDTTMPSAVGSTWRRLSGRLRNRGRG